MVTIIWSMWSSKVSMKIWWRSWSRDQKPRYTRSCCVEAGIVVLGGTTFMQPILLNKCLRSPVLTSNLINWPLDPVFLWAGIMAGWFDACPGFVDTAERLNAVDFTKAFTSSSARFQVLPGNPRDFDPANVTGSTISEYTWRNLFWSTNSG